MANNANKAGVETAPGVVYVALRPLYVKPRRELAVGDLITLDEESGTRLVGLGAVREATQEEVAAQSAKA